ncbi:4a-hydroxytetrahydrobiopterin dehydratase [Fibrobacterota bacterium]
MESIAETSCEACRAGAPRVTEEEELSLHSQVLDWEIVEIGGIKRLVRTFRFPDFIQSLTFTGKVGVIAEEEGHHPSIVTEYGKVEVSWWSHKIRGLHRNDFIMAAKTDKLYA